MPACDLECGVLVFVQWSACKAALRAGTRSTQASLVRCARVCLTCKCLILSQTIKAVYQVCAALYWDDQIVERLLPSGHVAAGTANHLRPVRHASCYLSPLIHTLGLYAHDVYYHEWSQYASFSKSAYNKLAPVISSPPSPFFLDRVSE
jgi:hypothetical protein